jgi:hypothetical protein
VAELFVAELDDADLGIGLLLGIHPGEVEHFGPVNIDPHRTGIADYAFDLDIVPCVGVQNRSPVRPRSVWALRAEARQATRLPRLSVRRQNW